MSKVLELRAERHAIVLEMQKALELNSAEGLAKWKVLDEKQENLGAQIDHLDYLENRMERAQLPNINGGDPAICALNRVDQVRSTNQYARDFNSFLRTGEQSTEMRALGDSSGQPGAALVPIGFQRELETKMKYWGGLINICRTIRTASGNPLNWPTMDDTGNVGEFLTEGSATTTTGADPNLATITIGSNLVSSKQVKFSVQLMQDADFSVEGLISDAFGERLGRVLDTAYLLGDGTDVPITGLLTALLAAGGRGVEVVGSNSNDGVGTDLNSLGSDDFSALINGLDRAYQKPTNKFVFSQTTQNALRKLKDKYGRPIWEVSLAQGEPDKIFGYGYQIDNAMANIGAGNISVLFGDFDKYIIRNSLGITLVRFNELYMTNYQVAFQSFLRTDAKLLQPAAFAYLFHSQS